MTCLTAILLALVMALGGCAVGDLIFDKEYTIDPDKAVAASGKPIEEVGNIAFAGNHALFYSACMLTVSHLRSYDVDFGIIPNPKYNKEQPHYSSMMHSISGMVSVPKSVKEDNIGRVSAMIEAMAYHAVDTLTGTVLRDQSQDQDRQGRAIRPHAGYDPGRPCL